MENIEVLYNVIYCLTGLLAGIVFVLGLGAYILSNFRIIGK